MNNNDYKTTPMMITIESQMDTIDTIKQYIIQNKEFRKSACKIASMADNQEAFIMVIDLVSKIKNIHNNSDSYRIFDVDGMYDIIHEYIIDGDE